MAKCLSLVFVWLLVVVMAVNSCAITDIVPAIPSGIKGETSSLFNIWSHAMRNQDKNIKINEPTPKTMLNPEHGQVTNLVPMDAPHPLYADKHLRAEFLKDYMIEELIKENDPRMEAAAGLTVLNLNGKSLTFKKTADGKITVNDINVSNVQTLGDNLISYSITKLPFGHQDKVNAAFHELLKKEPSTPFTGPVPPIQPLPPH